MSDLDKPIGLVPVELREENDRLQELIDVMARTEKRVTLRIEFRYRKDGEHVMIITGPSSYTTDDFVRRIAQYVKDNGYAGVVHENAEDAP
jgi:hypothetical protein